LGHRANTGPFAAESEAAGAVVVAVDEELVEAVSVLGEHPVRATIAQSAETTNFREFAILLLGSVTRDRVRL
jgi:hypothetical protein